MQGNKQPAAALPCTLLLPKACLEGNSCAKHCSASQRGGTDVVMWPKSKSKAESPPCQRDTWPARTDRRGSLLSVSGHSELISEMPRCFLCQKKKPSGISESYFQPCTVRAACPCGKCPGSYCQALGDQHRSVSRAALGATRAAFTPGMGRSLQARCEPAQLTAPEHP